MCYIAKLFGSKVIFIETFANRTSGTVAGRLVYPIADTFVVQWKKCTKYIQNLYVGGGFTNDIRNIGELKNKKIS